MSCSNRSGPKVRRGRFSLTMRILITGGFGFVGGRLAAHLAQAGHQIVLGSRKAIGPPAWLLQAEVAQINWDDAAALERSCKSVDVVIQAAGMNAQDCATDPVAALAFNGVATARLVAAASRAGVKRIIYLSTAHVYASPLVGTITEETCPRNLHPYATSHLAGEHAVLSAGGHGHIQGIVLRLSNAFGAPMHKDVNCWMLLVNDLCRQAIQKRKLILYSSGQQQRDFIGMTEVCRVAERLAFGSGDVSQTGIFNIGAGVVQPVFAMAQTIQQRCLQVLGFEPELQREQDRAKDPFAPLTYRTDRLDAMGLKLDGVNNLDEIDHLLRYCNTTFGQTQRPDS
jgi:UDP-glucose 4-epimerase